jgi:hypothetical protein
MKHVITTGGNDQDGSYLTELVVKADLEKLS